MTDAASVHVVLATYDRPGPLRVALESVLAQTHADWRVWVVGDACGPATAEVVAACRDARIGYLNLPRRFGEQAGPNSVGLDLADGAYVAFLNHDDVWLPRHLEGALAALRGTDSDFHVAATAIAVESADTPDGGRRPVFRERGPTARDPWAQYAASKFAFEPCSAWVVATRRARRIGPWRAARTIYRTPLEDWFLRAARSGARFSFGDEITTLKFNTHNRRDDVRGAEGDTPSYTAASPEHEWVAAHLRAGTSDVLAEHVARDLREHPADREARTRRKRTGALQAIAMSRFGHHLFRRTGIDLVSVAGALRGDRKGAFLRRASLRRTGEELPEDVSIDEVREIARAARRGHG